MSTVYYLSANNSDLSGGADFNRKLVTSAESANTIALTIANNATETSYAFTEPGVPGTSGGTGDITVKVNVTVANGDVNLRLRANRVNSSGTVQASTSTTSNQTLSATGVYNYTIPGTGGDDLGTWASGDRLRIDYEFRDTNAMDGAESITIGTGTANETHTAPWTLGTTYNDNYSEAVTPADSLTAANTMPVTRSEAVTPDVTLATAHTMPNAYSAAITPDVTLSAGNVMAATLSEAATAGFALTAGLVIAATVSFDVTPADAQLSVMTFNSAYSESITPADDNAAAATYNNALSESVTPGVILNQQFDEVLSESLTASDSYVSSQAFFDTYSEGLTVSFTPLATVQEPGGWFKPGDLSDDWTQSGGGAGDWTQIVGPADSWTQGGGGNGEWQEIIGPDDEWTET